MKEKLVELIFRFCEERGFYPCVLNGMADYLIDNGVTIPVRCRECVHYCLHDAADGKYCEILRYESPIESGWCCYGERRAE